MIYRQATPADRADIIDFINMVFSMSWRPHDFRTLLPKVYGDGRDTARLHYIAEDDDGHIRGVVAVLPELLRVLDYGIHIGYVGSVSIHPQYRGEGHMKALMEMAIERAKADGLDMLVLDGQRQRYGHYGFTRGGWHLRFDVNADNIRHALGDKDVSGYTFLPMRDADEWDIDAARALYFDQPAYIVRDLESFTATLESWHAEPQLILYEGALMGYLVASGDNISELRMYDFEALDEVLKAWMATRGLDSLTITAGPCERELIEALKDFAERWRLETDTQLRVLRFAPVLEVLLALRSQSCFLSDGETAMWIDGQPLTIRVNANLPTVSEAAPDDAPHISAMKAQRLFFDPLEALLDMSPSDWLPLPFYIASPDGF